jgi:hypothetical protein
MIAYAAFTQSLDPRPTQGEETDPGRRWRMPDFSPVFSAFFLPASFYSLNRVDAFQIDN